MNKAILVIDMPNCCDDCPLIDQITGACHFGDVDGYNYKIIRNGCPLKPLPMEAVNLEEVLHDDGLYYVEEIPLTDFDRGFNYCLDKILGEKIDE